MIRIVPIPLLAGILSLSSCGAPAAPDEQVAAGTASPVPPPDGLPPVPESYPSPTPTGPSAASATSPSKSAPYAGTNDGYPDLTPTPTTPDVAKTETGARAILLSWARGIELREFDQSWAMMGDTARTQVTKTHFNAMFAPLHDLVVSVPEGTMEGAAGSSYYTVPVTVTGTEAGGTRAKLKGDIIMRRVNDVPGATPEQLRWHIERVDLD